MIVQSVCKKNNLHNRGNIIYFFEKAEYMIRGYLIYLFDNQSTEVLILLSFFTVFPLSQTINQKCFFFLFIENSR